jgi:hypothetical protein
MNAVVRLFVHLLATALVLQSAAALALASCPNIERIECAFGTYQIRSIEQYRGSLTPESEQRAFLNSQVIVQKNLFRYRGIEIANPTYRLEVIDLPTEEGDIGPKHVSAFFGYETSRLKVVLVSVYSANELKTTFEVISPTKLWKGKDGYYFVATRAP